MYFEKEIERAVRHNVASDTKTTKSSAQINRIVAKVKSSLENSKYNFSNSDSIVLNKNGKKRFIKLYSDLYSSERILCQCVKQIIDRTFKIKYPNRNKIIKSFFGILAAVRQMSDFTIVKFDFKDYFNSVSTTYVFEKFLKSKIINRFELDLIKDFAYNTKYTYAGFHTSNAIAEIIARHFDDAIRQALTSKGILFFERYIDDSILILNEHIDEEEIKIILQKSLATVFYDNEINVKRKCKTKFNDTKFRYISRRLLSATSLSVDYLGYEFWFSSNSNKKIDIQYGITKDKRDKYSRRIGKLIECYINPRHTGFNNLELLRHRITAFSSRVVYLNKKNRSNVWKVKGFISNYGELRYLLGTNLIHNDTEMFLRTMVEEAFCRAEIAKPYFIKGVHTASRYNLLQNMKVNRTILLVDHIGYDYNSLVKLCAQIDIANFDSNGKRRGYNSLVRDYLIKVKVGY